MQPTHLADTSALVELHQTPVAARLVGLLVGGQVATCGVVDLELLALVPAADHADVLAERRLFPRVPCDDLVFDRAIEVQGALPGPPVPSGRLLVAAAAERAGLVLLHRDRDLERITALTGQPAEWIGP